MDESLLFRAFLVQEQKGKKLIRSRSTVNLHLKTFERLQKETDLTPPSITAYLLSLYDKGRKGTYLNAFIDTIHVYGRFKQTDIYKPLTYFPVEPFEKATMSDKEIEDFLALPCPTTTRIDPRTGKTLTYVLGDKRWRMKTLFWKCLAFSGARPGEIAHLTVNDVDFGRQIFLVNGKTGYRQIPIAAHLLGELQEYIKTLSTEYLFPSHNGRNNFRHGKPTIDDVDWGYDFHHRLKRLGIKRKNLTPYSLRHSFVTRMLSEDINIFKVQKIVGHRRIETTMGYTHLTTKDMIKTISQDPLGVVKTGYNERFEQFRNNVRQLLQTYCVDVLEESRMLSDLLKTIT